MTKKYFVPTTIHKALTVYEDDKTPVRVELADESSGRLGVLFVFDTYEAAAKIGGEILELEGNTRAVTLN